MTQGGTFGSGTGAGAMLRRYNALDLTAGRSGLAGSMLGHFGMRVLKPVRDVHAELSDVTRWVEASGKQLWVPGTDDEVRELAARVDVILIDETSAEAWGVEARALANVSGAVVCAMTPYGLEGPLAGRAASELTLQAAGGQLYLNGYPDRAPLPMPGNQARYQAAAQAVVAITAALHARETQGAALGLIDASAQEAVCVSMLLAKSWWTVSRINRRRSDMNSIAGTAKVRLVWEAGDGFVCWRLSLGVGAASRRMQALMEWIVAETGEGQAFLAVDWGKVSTLTVTPEEIAAWETQVGRFFATKTRQELFDGAVSRDILLLPVLTLGEVLEDKHVKARESVRTFRSPSVNGASAFAVPAFPVRSAGAPAQRLAPELLDVAPTATRSLPDGTLRPGLRPLEGVKVLDLCWMIAGPLTTQTLGLLGATVIRVETRSRLDTMRVSPPFVGKPSRDRSGGFAAYNANKRGITLNLNKPGSREVMERLVRWADVVCENFTPGRMEQWNLGFEQLRAWNPGVVMLRSSTWGLDGPYREIPANGIILAGFAGYTNQLGWPDRRPVSPGEPYTDLVSPWYNASAIIAALIARRQGGGGIELDISQLDSALNFVAPELAKASSGNAAGRQGPMSCDPYPSGVFRSSGDDEWCAMTIDTSAQWGAACAAIPGLSGCERLERAALAGITPLLFSCIATFFRGRSAAEAARALARVGVPVAPVASPEDLVSDPQLSYRRHFVERPHPAMGLFAYERSSFRFADCDIAPDRSPLFGEHNAEVFAMLGYSDRERDDLQAAGVLA